MEILFATGNKDKMKEIKQILTLPRFELVSSHDAGIDLDVVEDGNTFEENAIKKALETLQYVKKTKPELSSKIVMADDSGLEIDCLNKEPGVHSARYMGHDTSYEIKNKKILELIKQVPKTERTARFVCVIASAFPSGKVITTTGKIEGIIAVEPRGANGFGYDPIFFVEEYQMTIGEMDLPLKNQVSHRFRALKAMEEKLLTEAVS